MSNLRHTPHPDGLEYQTCQAAWTSAGHPIDPFFLHRLQASPSRIAHELLRALRWTRVFRSSDKENHVGVHGEDALGILLLAGPSLRAICHPRRREIYLI